MLTLTPNHQEELAAMVGELQSNRAVLDGLTNWYEVFVFTGGRVPTADWSLIAMTSYLEHPSAADCLWTSGIEHYRRLVKAITDMDQAGAGPRTLRCRHDLGDRFGQAASAIRLVSDSLESSMTKAMERPRPPHPVASPVLVN